MDVELDPLLAAVAVEVGEEPDQAHRQRRQQERGADDRPDRDVFGALRRAEQGDDRDQRLRHRRPDRGEDAADRPLPQIQLVPAHSTALVNSSAPARTTAKLTSRSRTVLPRPAG